MADREFRSVDRRFGMKLPEAELDRMLAFCKKAGDQETGGILVGTYSQDLCYAIVKAASAAPEDSVGGATWFQRGVCGLQRWLNGLWSSRTYYLGEWHFHPSAAPNPSGTDVSEMGQIAAKESYNCPEPILLILGGDPAREWRIRVFVFLRSGSQVELLQSSGMQG